MIEENLPITEYTAESRLRQPIQLLKEMWRDLLASRELALRLVIRDISAQYRQTALGYFWAIFPPLVSSFAFILLNSSKVIDVKDVGIPYTLYIMTGTVFWQLFVDAINAPLKVVTESKAVLTKINLPKEALILASMGQVLFSFAIKILLLVGVCVYYQTSVGWTALFALFPLLALMLMGIMLGVLLIPVGLLYKDIQHMLIVATAGLMFLTPVAYPPATPGTLGKIMQVNPLTPLIMTAKGFLFEAIPTDIIGTCYVFGGTLVLLFVGWILYRLALPIIIERIGA